MDKNLSVSELMDAFEDQRLLIEIGRDLMRIRDLDKLLRRILDVCLHMTGADAGSIYLAEDEAETPTLRFKYSRTISLDLPYEEFTMPRTMKSIAGYVSLTGESVNIQDVYHLAPELPYSFNNSFDLAHGYRTKSVLAVPMADHTGAIVGVIQLLNSKEKPDSYGDDAENLILTCLEDFEKKVVPFKDRYVPLMEAVAAQAAVALENAWMLRRILTQFEEFVAAAVEAVEARDPATSGHSARVAHFAVELAKKMNDHAAAAKAPLPFGESAMKELEYAGLLHDFGKVYIDPSVFLKAKKLFPGDYDRLMLRLRYLKRSIEFDMVTKEVGAEPQDCRRLEDERRRCTDQLAEIIDSVITLNEPTPLDEDPDELIQRIRATTLPPVAGVDEEDIPILTDEEVFNLRTRRGSLNPNERAEIERHVVRSYEFVKRIPWPPEYRNIPKYVKAHHEMLDGSGYPDGLRGDEIPLQARVLAVVDVYDALTASDRPYKKSLSSERALSILEDEAQRGRLDGSIVTIMREHINP